MADIIDTALMAHAQIKQRLKTAILDPADVDPESVRSDRLCLFGLWIYGEQGAVHCGRPEFQALKAIHKRFHDAAYSAFCNCQSGRLALAQASIDGGEFEQMSIEMKSRLLGLRQAIRPNAFKAAPV